MILKFKRMSDYCVHCEASRSVAQADRSCVLRSRLAGEKLPHEWAHEVQRAQIEAARANPKHIPTFDPKNIEIDFAPFVSETARDEDRARTKGRHFDTIVFDDVKPDASVGEFGIEAAVPPLPVAVVEGSRAASVVEDLEITFHNPITGELIEDASETMDEEELMKWYRDRRKYGD